MPANKKSKKSVTEKDRNRIVGAAATDPTHQRLDAMKDIVGIELTKDVLKQAQQRVFEKTNALTKSNDVKRQAQATQPTAGTQPTLRRPK
ncbi:MAG: hypothetical protein K0S27_766 [Gammaproteobacteria bacterium]|jgi:hypothetical protein|nr:hypothetical protein [Gammaproteobacteria bacterium]